MPVPIHLQLHLDQGQRWRSVGTYRGRYAPSPTGELHLGNLQTALLSWLQARRAGGVWLLRIDDLDSPRNRPGAIQSIQEDLHWLGLDWDGEPILQSRRRGLYYSWMNWLRREDRLFPCRCSRKELAGFLSYPGTCRDASRSWGWQSQRLPSWRLRVADDDPEASGDVVVRRADGFIAYQLATVIDELTLGISNVVRGEDLRAALPAQRSLYRALQQQPPLFHHGPLLCDAQGRKLSKRAASAGLAGLRQIGLDPPAVIGRLAAGLGLIPMETRLSARSLLEGLTQDLIHAAHS